MTERRNAYKCLAAISGQEASTSGREYLAYFLHRHLDFRLPELESLLDYEDKSISYSWRKPFGGLIYSPFWYLRLLSDDVARKLCDRVLLLKVKMHSASHCNIGEHSNNIMLDAASKTELA